MMPDLTKLTDAELEDLECELHAERLNRMCAVVRSTFRALNLNPEPAIEQLIEATNMEAEPKVAGETGSLRPVLSASIR
jgi:hypothetical protein